MKARRKRHDFFANGKWGTLVPELRAASQRDKAFPRQDPGVGHFTSMGFRAPPHVQVEPRAWPGICSFNYPKIHDSSGPAALGRVVLVKSEVITGTVNRDAASILRHLILTAEKTSDEPSHCLLYTSDAADER